LRVKDAILDGEVVSIDDQGRTDFGRLQTVLSDVLNAKDQKRLVYYVFDLLWMNGEDLRDRPLLERKAILEQLLKTAHSERVRYSEHWTQEGPEVLAASCSMNMEGIISKRVDSLYESARSGTWLKSKCTKGQEFIIGGYSEPKGGRYGFGSLLLGAYDENNMLRYVGRVGTGFDGPLLSDIYEKLGKMTIEDSPFEAASPKGKDITFVQPELVCQIRFAEWTKDRMIRQAVFDGLREDKDASLVKIENEANTGKAKRAAAKRVTLEHALAKKAKPKSDRSDNKFALSHPDKVLYPEVGVTKQMMAEYYEKVQHLILPHVTDRPLSLVRCPDGAGKECFFQKRMGLVKPKAIHVKHLKGKEHQEEILTVDNVKGLYELVQMGVLEIHNWGTHIPKIRNADLIVFDLDPDEGLTWQNVKDAALDVKEILEKLNLKTWIKTTGGKGLHIHVPVLPEHSFDDIKAFSLSVVRYLEQKHPDRYTSQSAFAKRKGRIFLDYLRNGYGATSVAPYSLRAKANASVALPIAWEELSRLKGAGVFTIENIDARLRGRKDPWAGYFRTRQSLDLGKGGVVGTRSGARKKRR
jgi:bifunctional non-homologous end joining protein LigD